MGAKGLCIPFDQPEKLADKSIQTKINRLDIVSKRS